MELIAECKTQKDMRDVKKQVSLFQIYWPTSADCEQALDTFVATRFNSGLSMPDAVIGATAIGLSATLFTFNTRDFKSIKGLDFKAPYTR